MLAIKASLNNPATATRSRWWNVSRRKTAEWDKRLNIAYQKAVQDAGSAQRDQLRAARRLWVQYRDANCLYYGMGEGTIARLDAGECMRSMTEARAKELEGLGHQ